MVRLLGNFYEKFTFLQEFKKFLQFKYLSGQFQDFCIKITVLYFSVKTQQIILSQKCLAVNTPSYSKFWQFIIFVANYF